MPGNTNTQKLVGQKDENAGVFIVIAGTLQLGGITA